MSSDSWSIKLLESLAEVLRDERAAKGVSVYYLSQESGVSEQSIHNYEKGLRHPTIEKLALVSKALGLKTSEIIVLAENRVK